MLYYMTTALRTFSENFQVLTFRFQQVLQFLILHKRHILAHSEIDLYHVNSSLVSYMTDPLVQLQILTSLFVLRMITPVKTLKIKCVHFLLNYEYWSMWCNLVQLFCDLKCLLFLYYCSFHILNPS